MFRERKYLSNLIFSLFQISFLFSHFFSCRVEKAFDGLLKRLAKYQVFEAYSVDVKESIANAKVCNKSLAKNSNIRPHKLEY